MGEGTGVRASARIGWHPAPRPGSLPGGRASLEFPFQPCRGFQKLAPPFRTLPRFSEPCPAVQNLAAVFRSLPRRSEPCRSFQKLAPPFRTLPRFSEPCPAAQNLAAVFRSLSRRSEPCRGFQNLVPPFRTLPRFSEACPAAQNLAAVFRTLSRRSEPCRGFQKLTAPAVSAAGHSSSRTASVVAHRDLPPRAPIYKDGDPAPPVPQKPAGRTKHEEAPGPGGGLRSLDV
jgi:hypothetical protein